MTEPTLESLNEAARAANLADWHEVRTAKGAWVGEFVGLDKSIRAHALTLDKLHGRNEASEAELFYREVFATGMGCTSYGNNLDDNDRKAIALIEAKFAELRLEWMADMVAPKDKFPNYRYTIRTSMT